ncbi:tetratricopeptide repeat protein [Cognataquiflexum rubidum]|uniref:tetratricopeptide repeat-containing sensor histidine kinase n=1 Tax=Cognataquiflexum rubidum TaxID=2922273 RepID=UPI001F12C563|nr:tetratricopeptide repeat protein [Cognataquiflexum rubidum]MCH6235782.1 tetratricopeptide repeat protein [Cognataquiflexum rubidum]
MKALYRPHGSILCRLALFMVCFFFLPVSLVQAQTIENLKAELEKLSQKHGYANDTLYLNKANDLGFMLAESNPDSAFVFLDKQIEMCQKADYKKGESDALKIYGNALQNKGEFAASIDYYKRSLAIAQDMPDDRLIPGILNNIGLVYFNLGNYAEALGNFFEAIKGAEQTGNLNVEAAALNNIAMIYFEQGKLEEAKTKYQEMLVIYQKMGNQGRMILAYNNLGDVELKQNKPLEALDHLKVGHASALALQSPEFIEMTARTLADIYVALDSTDKAENLYRQSIAIAKEKGYGVPYSHSLVGLAELYYGKGNYQEARLYANEGLEQANKMKQAMQQRNAHELLAKINERQGDFEEALANYKLFKQYNDSINNARGQRLAATLEAEYEFSKKTLEFEKASLRQWWLVFSAFIGLFTFLIILFIVYRNRNKLNKAFLVLKEKNVEIESKNEKLENALDQLRSTQLQLIQSEKMASLGELTAGIAHEIQNPLNFVNNFSEVSKDMIAEIEEERAKSDEVRDESLVSEILGDVLQNLERIHQHGKRADAIVKGMLEHSRTGKGEKILTDINALTSECLRLSYHGFLAKDKNFKVDFRTELDPGLPKANVVPQDLSRVFINIINNAFQAFSNSEFIPDRDRDHNSELKPLVKVSTMKNGDNLEIRVSDNGPGIPDAIKDKIFQPFFTTKPTGQGTGLGLSLSYDIVKAHGGELKVNSIFGEGTEFLINLPYL